MYCVRYKKKTETSNEQLATTSNNRSMKRGKCAICGNNKNTIC